MNLLMNWRHTLAISGCCLLLPGTAAAAYQPPAGYSIIDAQTGDVSGDGQADTVYLIGRYERPGANFAGHLQLVVYNPTSQTYQSQDLDDLGGYQPKLFLGDFTGDKCSDIWVQAPTGGSGGIVENRIVTWSRHQPQLVFGKNDNAGIQLTGKFIDDFKLELKNPASHTTLTLDLSNKKQQYVREGLYTENGKLQKNTKAMLYPLYLEAIDRNHDGTYELRGTQRLSGAYGADGLGHIYSLWHYKAQKWQPEQVEAAVYFPLYQPVQTLPGKLPDYARHLEDSVLTLTEQDDNRHVSLQQGDILTLRLQENGSTGYVWSPQLPADGTLELVGESTEIAPGKPPVPGAPTTKIYLLRAAKTGTTTLQLTNGRPWEKTPAKTYRLTVSIDA